MSELTDELSNICKISTDYLSKAKEKLEIAKNTRNLQDAREALSAATEAQRLISSFANKLVLVFSKSLEGKSALAKQFLPKPSVASAIPENVDVDVCIINYKTKTQTVNAVKSVLNNTPGAKIFLLDNNSGDGSYEAFAKEFGTTKNVTLIKAETNLGYGKGCNRAASMGTAPVIVFMNGDAAVTPGWFGPLKKTLEIPKVFAVAPKLINRQNKIVGCGVVGTDKNRVIRGWLAPAHMYNQTEEVVSLCGAVFACHRSLFKELGGFYPAYQHYFEETSLFLDARLKGYKVYYCGSSVAFHEVNGSCRDNTLLRKYFLESKKIFDERYKAVLK